MFVSKQTEARIELASTAAVKLFGRYIVIIYNTYLDVMVFDQLLSN